MIHEAKITFHNLQYFNFTRKQDATNYKLETQYDLYVMIDRIDLSFLVDHQNPLCKIKTKMFDFNFQKDKTHAKDNQLTILYIPPAKKSGEAFHIRLATIKSSKSTIHDIKDVAQKNRKYKSCLAFIPSRLKHISILSGQSPTQRFRGFINLAAVMFLILNLRNIIENFIRYGIQFGQTPTQFLPISFIVAMSMYLAFLLVAYLIQKLKFKDIFSPIIFKILYIIMLFGILVFNVFYCLLYRPSPVLGILHTTVAIIMLLKLISYYQVNNQLYSIISRMKKKAKRASQKQIQIQMFTHYQISQQNLEYIMKFQGRSAEIINLKELFYFLFIPTLCYQLAYPKTSSIRYAWLFKRIVELIIVIGFQGILWVQYVEPQLNGLIKALHVNDSTWYVLFNRFLRLSIPNTMGWIAGFYCVFHLWLNVMGQILYFGDRNFYRDWWNCRSIQEYWKTWNLPVHFWFIRHVYNPMLQLGASKLAANLFVFFISAIAHEYLVSVPLGFISYWAFLSMLMQAPAIFIQNKLGKLLRIQNSQLSNVSFWIFFCIIGQPMVVFIYYSMYTDYKNNTSQSQISGFIPLNVEL